MTLVSTNFNHTVVKVVFGINVSILYIEEGGKNCVGQKVEETSKGKVLVAGVVPVYMGWEHLHWQRDRRSCR